MLRKLFALVAVAAFAPVVFAEDEKKADEKKPDRSKVFAALDADSDGKLTKDEYKKSLEKMTEKAKDKGGEKGDKAAAALEKIGEKMIDKLFDKLDADKDGTISKDEFEKAEFDASKLKDLKEQFGKKK
jgi:Ca2+-binding EF-hand superfamily protein